MSSASAVEANLYRFGPIRHLMQWLDAMPHPASVCEIAPTHVAAARWGRSRGDLERFAVEPLAEGTIVPSPIEANVGKAEALRATARKVLSRVQGRGTELALLVPDPVVRVFILPFETFPRRADEAVPLLRWRLKKSVPFDVEETVVSSMRQAGRNGKLEVVAAVARQKIIREYETAIEAAGMTAGVVLSSGLATLPLLDEKGATLLARVAGKHLTTAIVRGRNLCVYRSTEMPADPALLEPRAVLEEVFPAIAFYQDTWGSSIGRVCFSGFAAREEVFRRAVRSELGCQTTSLAAVAAEAELPKQVQSMMDHQLEALVGWEMNRGV